MVKSFCLKLHRLFAPENRDDRRIIATTAALLSLIYCFCTILNSTQAAFTITSYVQSEPLQTKYFTISVTDESAAEVTGASVLPVVANGTPYNYSIEAPGTAEGYCEVTVTDTTGVAETRYIYPIEAGQTVNLTLNAAIGSQISFDYGWGSPPENSTVVAPAQPTTSPFLMRRLFQPPMEVCLDISKTPYETYTVPERATLLAIAAHYGVEVEDILTFNDLYSAEEVTTGTQLLIPNPTTTVPYAPAGLYTVVEGDTLGIIAERFDVTVRSLCQWNNLPNENTLGVGMTLKIPIIYKPSTEDTTAVETTPVETTPVETTPVETTPVETTPVETTPVETTPTETTPVETTPVETTPVETTPVESTPEESTPEESTPEESTPEESTPEESTPVESTPEESTPVESTPEESTPEESTPEESTPEESTPAESTSKETASKETASENAEQDDTVYVCGVPLYFQDDYPDTRYGNGTVKTSGCSVTSLTMVANAITGYDYTVDELADYFGGRAENNIARLETGSETLGLSFYKSENIHKTMEALEEGKIAIVLMDGTNNPNCLFTNSQHFIVLTGLNEEGKIMVNDSNPANYELWNLKNGFENGFEEKDILPGYSGAWVYDRELETQPPRYSAPRVVKTEENRNYDGITLTEEERYLLACLIWGEARGECAEGQQAVAEVVFNRLESGQFGSTITDIICGEGQFNSVTAGQLEKAEPGQAQYQAIDRALYGKRILPTTICYFSVYAGNADVYIQVGNHLFSFTHS